MLRMSPIFINKNKVNVFYVVKVIWPNISLVNPITLILNNWIVDLWNHNIPPFFAYKEDYLKLGSPYFYFFFFFSFLVFKRLSNKIDMNTSSILASVSVSPTRNNVQKASVTVSLKPVTRLET